VPSKIEAASPGSAGGGFQKPVSVSGVAYAASKAAGAVRPTVRSVQIHSDQRAKPSLSQMSFYCPSVTALPNHSCEISWTTVLMP
jgi:hypothetical protein